jgi:ribosomal protein S27AE
MTQYYCGKCGIKMNVSADVGTFKCLIKYPKCGATTIADHREDLG